MIFFALVLAAFCVANIDCDKEDEDPEYITKGDILIRKDPQLRGVLVKGNPWPGATVIYVIENGFRPQDIDLILASMAYISSKTCVKFKRRTNEKDYVGIRTGTGCNSEVGFAKRGRQTLTLQTPNCMQKGVIIHELIHTLGFDHEQCRYDRDNYVTVHYNNIQPPFRFAFDKLPADRTDLQGEPYDARSIMHYFWNAFAIDSKQPTITSKQSGITKYDLGRGQIEERMTDIDIRKMKKYYKCP